MKRCIKSRVMFNVQWFLKACILPWHIQFSVSLHLLGLQELHRQQQVLHLAPQLIQLGVGLIGLQAGLATEQRAVWARGYRGARLGLNTGYGGHGGLVEWRWVGYDVSGRLWKIKWEQRVSYLVTFHAGYSNPTSRTERCQHRMKRIT